MEKHKNYIITDTKTGLKYTGVAMNVEERFEKHIDKHRYDNKRKNYPLYVAMQGLSNQECRDRFIVEEIANCRCEGGAKNCETETKIITQFDLTNPKKGYNQSRTNGCFEKGNIPTNKKTNSEVDQDIVMKWKGGKSMRSLAREYGIDRAGIRKRIRSLLDPHHN